MSGVPLEHDDTFTSNDNPYGVMSGFINKTDQSAMSYPIKTEHMMKHFVWLIDI